MSSRSIVVATVVALAALGGGCATDGFDERDEADDDEMVAAANADALAKATGVMRPFSGVTVTRHPGSALTVGDLCAAGVSVRSTKYAERKATAKGWAETVQADVAINGDFFDFPGWSWMAQRARGAGEDWPASAQRHYAKEVRQYVEFGPRIAKVETNSNAPPAPGVTEIVGGHNLVISGGRSLGPRFDGDGILVKATRHTVVGLSGDRSFVYFYVTDKARTGAELVDDMMSLAREAGAPPIDVATSLDGGGSSQMYVRGQGAIIPSSRPVANHLGLYARGSGAAPQCARPPAPPPPPPAKPAYSRVLLKTANDLCLDIDSESNKPGARLLQFKCVGHDNQRWNIVPAGGGFYSIESAQRSDKGDRLCLDVVNFSRDRGAKVIQWPCHGGDNQLWARRGDEWRNKHSGQNLDVPSGTRDTVQLQQWPDNNNAAQRFRISK